MTAFINGTDFAEYGVRVLAGSQYDALPETRDRTITIPGMHGALDYGADLGVRPFDLKCALIDAVSPTDLQRKLRLLTAELTDAYGRPKTFELSFSEEPEKHYRVRYSGRVSVDRIYKLGFFSLPLTAYDPASYASLTAYDPAESQTYDSGLVYDSGLYYPNSTQFQWKFRKQYYGCYNYSPYVTPLVLSISGKVSNPTIINQTTGESIDIKSQIKGTLILDGLQETITYPGATYEGEYIGLASGFNSLLFEGLVPDATVTINWKHKFI